MLLGKQAEKFAPGTELESKVEFLLVLEGIIELNDKRMIHADQNVSFYHNMHFLFALLDVFFLQYLHGIDLTVIVLSLDQNHLGVGSLPYYGKSIEVLQAEMIVHINLFICKHTGN